MRLYERCVQALYIPFGIIVPGRGLICIQKKCVSFGNNLLRWNREGRNWDFLQQISELMS